MRVAPKHYDAELAFSYYRLWRDDRSSKDLLWYAVVALDPKTKAIYRGRIKSPALLRDIDDLLQIHTMEMVRTLTRNAPDLQDVRAWDSWTHRATVHIFQHWLVSLPKFYELDEKGCAGVEMLSGSLSPASHHALLEEVEEALQVPDQIEQVMLDRVRFGDKIDLIRELHRAQNRGGNTRMLFRAFKVPQHLWEFFLDYTTVLRRQAMREIFDARAAGRTQGEHQ